MMVWASKKKRREPSLHHPTPPSRTIMAWGCLLPACLLATMAVSYGMMPIQLSEERFFVFPSRCHMKSKENRKPHRVLLVDDDTGFTALVRSHLPSDEFIVDHAFGAKEALDAVARSE